MTQNDVLILAKAGFNAQQIAALGSVQATPVAPTAVAPAPTPTPTPTPAPAPASNDAQINELLRQVGALTQTVQANAILATNQPIVQENTDTILAQVINPPTPQKGV